MNFAKYAPAVQLTSKDELGKAKYIAYFALRSEGVADFSVGDLLRHWEALAVSQPNSTRLAKKMSQSGIFPRSPKPNHFRLHTRAVLELDAEYRHFWEQPAQAPRVGGSTFVDLGRIEELRALVGARPDPLRLVRLCEEINTSYSDGCTMAVALLARTVINHVPPALGFKTFSEVANNYGGIPGSQRSFKKIAQRLEEAQRAIADSIAHETMRETESLPNATQIDFSQELDVLLGEVARVLRAKRTKDAA